ncbi:hypothetical protein K469DRAFT_702043 [Zopfia rhizophila CBS 207.26]|uniref:NACHT domain-containing protein n=1 Tax=Zopfia rhizophila CBS 207.26 TaxID=1314779 RepID=A0A6A6EFI5_9PEZI|nr:hypothetical protein K469DRAFT_702043 [Zopfia rhizophila CBS 207.26]
MPDTCNWILTRKQYNDWVNNDSSGILWIYGIPGSGKSVLASSIVDRLSSKSSFVPLLYFFCSSRNKNRRVSVHILRSLVFQLESQRPGLADLVEAAYKASTSKTADTFEQLWELFERMVHETKSLTCVVDGLDECLERNDEGHWSAHFSLVGLLS